MGSISQLMATIGSRDLGAIELGLTESGSDVASYNSGANREQGMMLARG